MDGLFLRLCHHNPANESSISKYQYSGRYLWPLTFMDLDLGHWLWLLFCIAAKEFNNTWLTLLDEITV